jgi:hypothetical protein
MIALRDLTHESALGHSHMTMQVPFEALSSIYIIAYAFRSFVFSLPALFTFTFRLLH